MTELLVEAHRDWYCPQCGKRDQTPAHYPNRYHTCPRLRMMIAPLVPEGVKARLTLVERQDYIGKEQPQLMQGRPVMALVTERWDGSNDARVFAPTVRIGR